MKLTLRLASNITRLILFASFSAIIFSCKSGSNEDEKDIVVEPYVLPEVEKISKSESLDYHNQCNSWYDTTLANTEFNGAVLVAKNGNVVFEKYRGVAHLGSNDSININTPFHIASVSKTFTAMIVLKLWQDNKLQLDEEISKYFSDFNYPGVTIRTLLNHRSGLPNYVHFLDELGWDKTKIASNQDIYNCLTKQKNKLKNISTPNTHFTYCNTNYALLALLIEKITKRSYAAYLKQQIFDPLGMKCSFVMENPDKTNITDSYDWRGQLIPVNHLDGVYGDKNIYSTVQDLLKWDRFLKSNILFSKKTLEQAYTPYSNEKQGIKNYGLGWRMNIYPDGNKVVYHNGWWHGNNASFIRLIKEDAVIIVLGNRYNRGVYKGKNLISIFSQHYDNSDEE
jgi:CubicO group peptidase (beta-lactamase class C family)